MNRVAEMEGYLDSVQKAIAKFDRGELNAWIQLLLDAYERDAVIYVFGNGGSGSTASHFACDINKGVSFGRDKRFRVIALNDNVPTLMAYANDVEYADIFVEPLRNFVRPGDVAVGISGSGNSENVLRAIRFAREAGATTVGITGYDGGNLRREAEYSVNARVDDMQVSEDVHMVLVHLTMRVLCGAMADSDAEQS